MSRYSNLESAIRDTEARRVASAFDVLPLRPPIQSGGYLNSVMAMVSGYVTSGVAGGSDDSIADRHSIRRNSSGSRTKSRAFRAGTRRTKRYAHSHLAEKERSRNRRRDNREYPFNELTDITGYDLYLLNRIKKGLEQL